MKRALYFLLAILVFASTLSAADWRNRYRKAKQPKAVPIEMENSAGGRELEGESEREREKKLLRALRIAKERKQQSNDDGGDMVAKPGPIRAGAPIEMQLKHGASIKIDLRKLPQTKPKQRERPEHYPPDPNPVVIESSEENDGLRAQLDARPPFLPTVQAPPPIMDFDGLDREFWGAGSPSDSTGDVGPTYYIQGVNTSVGIYRKSDGFQEAAFTFDTLMAQGSFGNQCDTENFGDPVILYDTFEDRWILTDFAFTLDGGGNVNPPVAFQCFAVSQTNNPLTGGWHFYSVQFNDGLNDYEKFGIWPDGLYMSANMFGFSAGGSYQGATALAFNKAQMYAGNPTVQVVRFNIGSGDFTVIPSNARLQTGTPPPGRPNLFVGTWNFLNAVTVYKFHVDWNAIGLSTFTGPDTPLAATSWPNAGVANAPQLGTATLLDVLQIRAMVQNQYTNFAGVESLWVPHTVRRANTTGFAAPRFYQVDVTGGVVAPNIVQAATFDPDGANVMHRFMPSLALDRAGNMALAYSTSNSTTVPAIKYAGRLAGDPINTFSQTEQTLFAGVASQTGTSRWGDYTTLTLDPDGCTFWYTNQYGNTDQAFNKRWKTRINSFRYPSCTNVGAGGTLTGTITETPGGAPISGATITFGARSTTTNGSGVYSFLNIPAGTYPSISATKPGYSTASASSIVVTDSGTTTQDFALSLAPTSACLTDTTQADFQNGVLTNLDLTTSPGDVTLSNTPASDQFNTSGTTTGTSFGAVAWNGQTFIAGVTGQLAAANVQLFCSGCGATPPNLTLSVRATSAGLPTGADLASVTIPGSTFGSGGTVLYTATFGTPATLTSGTQYALILRPVSAPAGSGYFWIRSSPSTYASGSRVLSADSGGTWSADTTRDFNFRTFMQTGYAASGNLVSGTKDSNPLASLTPIWSTLSWSGTVPANTSLQYQVAGSNNPGGPFNFVGPDGTAGTFYTTSPGTLTPLYNLRYAKYKAYLATTNSAATPTVNDVTMCFNDVDCSGVVATITPTPASVCDNSTGNTASGPAGMTSYSWGITNGTITSATNIQTITYTAGASGNTGLTLSIVAPSGCQASGSVNVPIVVTPAQPTITPGGPTTFCAGGSVTLTSSAASGNQWYLDGNPIGGETNTTLVVTASGSYTVITTDTGCSSPASAATVVTVNPIPPTPTITPGGPTTFCTGGSVTLTSSSASGNQWYLNGNPIGGETNPTYVATASGSYTVIVTASGCSSAASTATVVTVNPIPPTPTITPGGSTTFCAGGSVTLTSSAGSGNQWYLNGNPIGGATNTTYVATASGNYTVIETTNGCASAASSATTVTANPLPATPTITPGGPTTFCTGGSVTLTSSAASGNQWYLNGNPIGGATNTTYAANASGSYTVTTTDGNSCTSAASAATTVTVNPIPAQPTITPGGPTTFCAGGSVNLNSSSASGNQWYLNGNPIGGATSQVYNATASGSYTVIVTTSGCSSPASTATTVTVNPVPPAPTITPGGPTTFCAGGSVTLTSSSATGNQWRLNGNPIGGASNQTYVASVTGDYTVIVTSSGCASAPSAATTVTVNPNPNATITAPASVTTGSTGNAASVANAGAGATYNWGITGGTITAGTGTANITFTAGAVGTLTLNVTVTTSAGCSDTDSASVTVSAPAVTVTSVTPTNGSTLGGTSVTIAGTGFNSGATVTFGGTAATNVVVVNSAQITANTPAHAAGAVNVVVTNTNASTNTLTNGYTYNQQNFDPNGDSMIDPSDIFYLVNYLFLGGPAPAGVAGMPSGDANGDGVVDPADIFYAVFYLFAGGPAPYAKTPVTTAVVTPMSGQLSLGRAVQREGRWVVPVILTMDADSAVPQAMSLRVAFKGGKPADVVVHRGDGQTPMFEISRFTDDAVSYLVSFGNEAPLSLSLSRSAIVAELEMSAAEGLRLEIDPALTMLVGGGGTEKATVANRSLRVSGMSIERVDPKRDRQPQGRN